MKNENERKKENETLFSISLTTAKSVSLDTI